MVAFKKLPWVAVDPLDWAAGEFDFIDSSLR
jgi:hypothetical protein